MVVAVTSREKELERSSVEDNPVDIITVTVIGMVLVEEVLGTSVSSEVEGETEGEEDIVGVEILVVEVPTVVRGSHPATISSELPIAEVFGRLVR